MRWWRPSCCALAVLAIPVPQVLVLDRWAVLLETPVYTGSVSSWELPFHRLHGNGKALILYEAKGPWTGAEREAVCVCVCVCLSVCVMCGHT